LHHQLEMRVTSGPVLHNHLYGSKLTLLQYLPHIQKRKVKCVFFAVKSPAGSGVMGEDYQAVDNAEELVRMVDEKVAEIRAAEASGG